MKIYYIIITILLSTKLLAETNPLIVPVCEKEETTKNKNEIKRKYFFIKINVRKYK